MPMSIHFQGVEYASLDEMPPDVRAAYQAQHAGDALTLSEMLAKRKAEAGAPLAQQPAWGGPRPSGSVPVPAEFDAVSGLGKALAVHQHDGLRIFPNFGPPRPNVVVHYHEGLAYHTSSKDVHTVRFDEVASITSNLSFHSTEHGLGYTDQEYTLTKDSGDKLILDDGLKSVGGLADVTKQAVYARLGPPLSARYQAGEALSFGPVTVQRQNGCQLDGKLYAWDAIQDVQVESGRFKLTLRAGHKHEARVSAIPNIELLAQLIGLRMSSAGLTHY